MCSWYSKRFLVLPLIFSVFSWHFWIWDHEYLVKKRGHAALVIFRLTSSGVSCAELMYKWCPGLPLLSDTYGQLKDNQCKRQNPPWKRQNRDHSWTSWLAQPSIPSLDEQKTTTKYYKYHQISALCSKMFKDVLPWSSTWCSLMQSRNSIWWDRIIGLCLMPTDPQYSLACIFTCKSCICINSVFHHRLPREKKPWKSLDVKANLPLVKAQLANIRPQQKDVLGAGCDMDSFVFLWRISGQFLFVFCWGLGNLQEWNVTSVRSTLVRNKKLLEHPCTEA